MPLLRSRELAEVTSTQLTTLLIESVVGILLAYQTSLIERFPPILLILPALLALRGDVSGALAARLSTGLHLGVIRPWRFDREVLNNWIGAIFVTVIMTSSIGILAYFWTGQQYSLPILVAVTVAAGLLASLPTNLVIMLIAMFTYYRGINPDNVVIPLATSLGDIIGFLALLATILLFLPLL
ncbi:magnesium transporter [archaeon]|nr:magnesium transporter [archaeon]